MPLPGVSVDGNDILAVYSSVEEAIAFARKGEGPTFIECKTFRMKGHSAHDAAEYVHKELLRTWGKRDPILRLEKLLLERRVVTSKRVKDLEREVEAEIDEAVAFA